MSRGAVRWRCALSRTIDHSEIGSVSIDIHRLAEAEFRSDGTSEGDNVISPAWSVVVSNAEALPEATDDLGSSHTTAKSFRHPLNSLMLGGSCGEILSGWPFVPDHVRFAYTASTRSRALLQTARFISQRCAGRSRFA